jgi:hypothetical protein
MYALPLAVTELFKRGTEKMRKTYQLQRRIKRGPPPLHLRLLGFVGFEAVRPTKISNRRALIVGECRRVTPS